MKSFVERCEEVADELGIDVIDSYEGEDYQEPFEDDGILHVMEGNTRVAFDVSNCQNLHPRLQNIHTKSVMECLGLKVTKRVLV